MASKEEAKYCIRKNNERIAHELEAFAEKYKFAHLFCERTSTIAPATMLYHILPCDYFVKVLKNRELRFSSIDMWRKLNDKNEGFLFNLTWHNENGFLESADNFLRNIYAMSWTNERESEEMWRHYGANKGHGAGVRIGVRAIDLICALYEFLWKVVKNGQEIDKRDFILRHLRMANITYKSEYELQESYRKVKKIEDLHFDDPDFLDNFSVKEQSFAYEHEIRLYTEVVENVALSMKDNQHIKVGEWLKIPFDISKIQSVVVNPFADKAETAVAVIKLHEGGLPLEKFMGSSLG